MKGEGPVIANAGSSPLAIAATKDHLVQGGHPFFYVADTIWSAFTHVPDAHWEAYLNKRAGQGFNALQISVLPILHDMSASAERLPEPFPGFWDGRPLLGELAGEYGSRAVAKVAVAREMGFVPVLVDIWCNYAPGTWASRGRPEYVFGASSVDEYLASVVTLFAPFDPVHIVSGDTDWAAPETIDFYAKALTTVKASAAGSLTALHSQPEALLPPILADSEALDLYVFQSGHHLELARLQYELGENYRARPVQRPVLNVEPPYEGHGYGFRYGRFGHREVRRAWWQGLLSGASAGVAYGAHGVWGWHDQGDSFNHAEFSAVPFDRWAALDFPGAAEVRFTAWLAESLGIYTATPSQYLAPQLPPEVRVATVPDRDLVVVYLPWAIEVPLELEGPARVERIDLERRECERLEVGPGRIRVGISAFNNDALVVVRGGQLPNAGLTQ